jgi:signal transduction histidine kinase
MNGSKTAKFQISETLKALLRILLLLTTTGLPYYFRFTLGMEVTLTDFLYGPVILIVLWWPLGGTLVALSMSLLSLISHLLVEPAIPLLYHMQTSLTLCAIALVMSALSGQAKEAEQEIRQRNKELRDAQEQLIRKEKLAVLGQLAGGVGHELRNPLAAIKNTAYFLDMVLEEPDPKVKEMLEILEKKVDTCERIINSLLDFARVKSPTRRKVDIDIKEMVQETLSRIAVPESVEVVSQLNGTLPAILTDPDQLVQVFGNIILNAAQAMPDGGQLIVESQVPSPEWVAVSFTDTGVGIPEENLGRLFEPLFTTKAKGIGLGLAVTKTLVEGHGGRIEVASEMGVGTTFTVRLPISVGQVKWPPVLEVHK